MRRRGAGAVEVREVIGIVFRVTNKRHAHEGDNAEREEAGIHAIDRGDVRLKTNLWCREPIVLVIEEDSNWSQRSEIFRDIWLECFVSCDAIGPSGRTMAIGHRSGIGPVLRRPE